MLPFGGSHYQKIIVKMEEVKRRVIIVVRELPGLLLEDMVKKESNSLVRG